MKKRSVVSFSLMLVTMMGASSVHAKRKYPDIYPFKPMSIDEIYDDVEKISEDKNFIRNFNQIIRNNLSKAKTDRKPWTSSYWPLAKGTIADPYENSTLVYYTDFAKTYKYQWIKTKESFDERKRNFLSKIDSLSSSELEQLAPSEKYDLLLGDKSFDLTTRIMENMYAYGQDNYFWNLNNISTTGSDTLELAEKYVSWGWVDSKGKPYGTIERALRLDPVLQTRVEVKRGIINYEAGLYNDLATAVRDQMAQAQAESGNYVIASRKVKNIASWEGICNGWSTAAGIIPRPTKAISFKLPDGRDLKFYPDDIKGLVSLYWFNSFVQNNFVKFNDKPMDGSNTTGGTLSVGLRCNLTSISKDRYGRLYDSAPDPRSFDHSPRCVGVHPAKWHLGLVNIIGKQGRSFVVERKVKDPVDNHPMHKYEMKYFNPLTGEGSRNLNNNIELIDSDDQFQAYRHKDAVYIVGVETEMTYLNYVMPRREETNSEDDDDNVNKTMFYDLELDKNYNIVGGQWRAVRAGKPKKRPGSKHKERLNHNQPDFFWAVTKNWKKTKYFHDDLDVGAKWRNKTQAPPRTWHKTAKDYHSFEMMSAIKYGNAQICKAKNTKTGKVTTVWCESKTNTPQPLPNVINTLIQRSSGISFKDF